MEIIILKKRRFQNPKNPIIRDWVSDILRQLNVMCGGVGILFCGPRSMISYQQKYRNKQTVTDVLSFPGEDSYLGDIVICVDRARDQAHQAGHSFEEEIRLLLVHALLHLAGYDHEKDRGEMLELQKQISEILT